MACYILLTQLFTELSTDIVEGILDFIKHLKSQFIKETIYIVYMYIKYAFDTCHTCNISDINNNYCRRLPPYLTMGFDHNLLAL